MKAGPIQKQLSFGKTICAHLELLRAMGLGKLESIESKAKKQVGVRGWFGEYHKVKVDAH